MNPGKILVWITTLGAVLTTGYGFFVAGDDPEQFRGAVLAALALLGIGTTVAATTGGDNRPALGPPGPHGPP